MLRKTSISALATAFLLAGLAVARSGRAVSHPPRRTVVVNVVTRHGRAVNGLTAKYFAARFRRKRVKIVSVTYDPGPYRVVLLLDTSGSMQDSRLAELTLAQYLLAWISPQDPVALATFDSKIRNRIPFSLDRTQANALFGKLLHAPEKAPPGSGYGGKTAIWNAVGKALDMLGPPRAGDAVCLLTDGGDNGAKEQSREVMRRCLGAGVRIFSLGVLPPLKGMIVSEENSGPDVLRELSGPSGGEVAWFSAADLRWLGSQWAAKHRKSVKREFVAEYAPLALLAREINAVYRLEIELPEPVDKPRGWSLKLVDPNNGKAEHLLLLKYPRRLVPTPSPDQQAAHP